MADETKKEAAPTYSAERLVAESEAFLGVPSHVAVGAFHGGKKTMTLDDAKSRVKKWLDKPEDRPEED